MKTIEQEIKTSRFASERHKAIVNVLFTAGWIDTKMHHELKQFGISHQQYNILRILRGQEKTISIIDIKSRMIDRMSNVSRLVEKLRQKGLVERTEDPEDRRKVEVSITTKGLFILEQMDQKQVMHNNFPNQITEEEAQQLNLILDKMRAS